MNIRKKFILFSIILGIVPVIISTSMFIVNFNARSMEIIKQNAIMATRDQSVHLEDFFNRNINELNVVGNMPITKEVIKNYNNKVNSKDTEYSKEILNQFLSGKKDQQSFLLRESLTNKDGVIIASSDKDYIDKKGLLLDEDIEVLRKNGRVITDIIQKEDFNNGIKSVIIASPIFIENKYEGAIINIINMSYFEKIVEDMRFFKIDKVAIIDSSSKVVYSSNFTNNVNEIKNSDIFYKKLSNIDLSTNPEGMIEYTINGVDTIVYYSKIENTEWIVFSGGQGNEFRGLIAQDIKFIIMILVFILALIGSSYTFIINHFSKPIYKLLEAIRRIKQGNYKDRFIYDKDNEFGEIATAFNDLIDNIEKNKKYIEDKNRNLQSLTSNIPGGFYRSRVEDGEYILDFLSVGCLNLLGYEKHEFKKIYNKRLLNLIYEKDRERVISEVKEQVQKSSKYTVEYRVKRKDESIIWILENGKMVKNRDGRLFGYSVIINITESKVIQEELRLSEQRYRIIMSQTKDIIFEWNVYKDTINYSENWKSKFGYEPIVNEVSKNLFKTDNIYKDDIKNLGKILNSIVNGEKYREIEIRIRKNTDEYIWCKIRMTAMFDENGNILKTIGLISDIDKEKAEAETLLFKAQRDSLTGLYNKGTVQSMIEDYIESEDANGALFVIDVDNFKGVNDNLGHLAGDFVLAGISSMLSKVFDENSIVGRIGGDEFIVFLNNIDSEELLYKKADDLVKGFRSSFEDESSEYKVSGSIGIAKYPQHGKSFKELFINADKAVYLAKSKGKDNYCIFEYI